MANNESDTSGIVVPDQIETRFGVELEICIKADALCLNYEGAEKDLVRIPFKEKFELFYKNIILKSSSFEYVKNKYTYIGIKSETGYYLYNMFTPFEADGVTVKSEIAGSKIHYFKDYSIPIIEQDWTIICGDAGSSKEWKKAGLIPKNWDQAGLLPEEWDKERLPKDLISMNFECITPILSFTGQSSDDKINNVLHPFLVLFGLEKPECIIINYSMGFHVNTSLYDTTEKRYITIGTPPFLRKLLKNYITQEKDIYSLVRNMRPQKINNNNKNNNNNYISFWAQPLYKNFNRIKGKKPTKSNNNIRESMTNKAYIDRKERALKYKSDTLLEFRLFGSSSNITTLLQYTAFAIELLHRTYRQMVKAGEEIPLEPLKVNIARPKVKTNGGNKYSKKHRKTYKKFRKFEQKIRHTKRHIHPINKY